MNKIFSMALMVITAMFIFFQSCGDVDHSNPRSVADKAMEYYISNDYEGMSTLCYPENTNRIERFLELEEYAKKNPDIRPKSTNKKFKYTDEKDHSYEYRVKYDYSFTNVNGKDETWHMTVILNNKEGKWYLDMVK